MTKYAILQISLIVVVLIVFAWRLMDAKCPVSKEEYIFIDGVLLGCSLCKVIAFWGK